MDLPQSVAAIGERLDDAGAIAADPQLLHGADVFAAERDRIFARGWMAADHHTRLAGDGCYFRFDVATRSLLVTRGADGRLHALRNVCLHAGYPICEAETGSGERLVCPYHGWEFALDGRLLEPDLSARIDPARLRLASHPVCIRDGLIFVDPSHVAAANPALDQAAADPVTAGALPDWLSNGAVAGRNRHNTNWNWKLALQFLKSSPDLLADDPGEFVVFGPLSLMMVEPHQAALLRVIPKSAERTDIELVRIAAPDAKAPVPAANRPDRLAEGLRQAGDTEAVMRSDPLDREFFAWYWSMISAN
jgi:nitrite reductase/ring-hydroxylating ferredoxin subunit